MALCWNCSRSYLYYLDINKEMNKRKNIWIIVTIAILLFYISQNTTQGGKEVKKRAELTMSRVLPSSANGGSTFNVRYTASGMTDVFGVLIEEDISGVCTPSHIATGFLGSIVSTFVDIAITAPASGSCTFTGNYQFADAVGTQPLVDFSDQTITITTNTCTDTLWTPVTSSQPCGVSFNQTSNCGATRIVIGVYCADGSCSNGQCIIPPQTCSQLSGVQCTSGQLCSGTMTQTTDTALCCVGGTCQAPAGETCEEKLDCDFWQECNDAENKCELASWVIPAVVIFGAIYFLSMMR